MNEIRQPTTTSQKWRTFLFWRPNNARQTHAKKNYVAAAPLIQHKNLFFFLSPLLSMATQRFFKKEFPQDFLCLLPASSTPTTTVNQRETFSKEQNNFKKWRKKVTCLFHTNPRSTTQISIPLVKVKRCEWWHVVDRNREKNKRQTERKKKKEEGEIDR